MRIRHLIRTRKHRQFKCIQLNSEAQFGKEYQQAEAVAEKSSKLESPIARLRKQEKHRQYGVCSDCRFFKANGSETPYAYCPLLKTNVLKRPRFWICSIFSSFIHFGLMIGSRKRLCFSEITNDDSSCLAKQKKQSFIYNQEQS